MDVQAESS
jgi:hypothetical protein